MTSLSELLMRTPTPEKLHQSEAWASQALGLIEKTQKQAKEKESICEQALAVALFNLGSIREVRLDSSSSFISGTPFADGRPSLTDARRPSKGS